MISPKPAKTNNSALPISQQLNTVGASLSGSLTANSPYVGKCRDLSQALSKSEPNLFSLLAVVYAAWALALIWRTSTLGFDGNRYFALFDDGMISMRYAKHIADGLGPVWNPGEFVEGYTNPLWVGLMSLAIRVFGAHFAPLVIQIIGLVLVVTSAYLVRSSALMIAALSMPAGYDRLAGFTAGALVFAYYPISFWALDGMEVSALTMLVAASLWITAADAVGRAVRALPLLFAIAASPISCGLTGFSNLRLWFCFRPL
jgi:hypothetical protein